MSNLNRSTPPRSARRSWVTLQPWFILCAAVSVGALVTKAQADDEGSLPYADTEWTSIHSGPSNNDYVPIDMGRGFRNKWTALDGASTLVAPTIGPEGNIYQTTGLGPGSSNLSAFDGDGNLLWQTPPWNDPSGFDSCPILSSAIIDEAGDLYVSDCNQFWAFHSDGTLKWVIDLPLPPAGAAFQEADAAPVNSFITGFFTKDGSVGGVTVFGNIVIVDREDGSLRYPVTDLPGGTVPFVIPAPPPFLAGIADPTLVDFIFNVALNAPALESIDTPSVSELSGRIFVSATGSTPGTGAIYGIDLEPGDDGALGSISIAFETPVAAGGGSSPALSPDFSTVYAGDGAGNLNAIDTSSGALIFSSPIGNEAASPAVGPDGRLYLLSGQGLALNPDGTIAWEGDYADLIKQVAPDNPVLGPAVAVVAGVISVTDSSVVFPLNVSYLCTFCGPQPVQVPVAVLMLTVEPETGELIEGGVPFFLRDTNEALTVPLENGNVLVNDGAFVSSLVAPLAPIINPLIAADGLQVIAPIGGLQTVEAIDEATINATGKIEFAVDGVASSGDFLVNLDAKRKQRAVSGSATIGSATVTPDIVRLKKRLYVGTIKIRDRDAGINAILFVGQRTIAAGFNAAGGTSVGFDFNSYKLFEADWLIRDWSDEP